MSGKWETGINLYYIIFLSLSIIQQQQAALMAAATAQGSYLNPMAALATQIPHALNGEYDFVLFVSIGITYDMEYGI